jgi:uncharacterized protein YjaZ
MDIMPINISNIAEVMSICEAEDTKYVLGRLAEVLDSTFRDAAAKLNLTQDVKAHVSLTDKPLPFPVCGCAPPNEIRIDIDRNQAMQIGEDLWAWLKSCVYHESNHVKRMLSQDCESTLEGALVAEGLALNFEEANGKFPYRKALLIDNEERLRSLAIQAKSEFGPHGAIANGNFYAVTDSWRIKGPVYGLGYALVKTYLDDKGQTAAEATQLSTYEILPWLDKIIDPNCIPSRPRAAAATPKQWHI